jgi:hypothetical protein
LALDLGLEGDEEGLLPPSLEELDPEPPPLDAPLAESLLEPPEVDEEVESPVLDWPPVDDDDSDFIALFRDSEG